MEQYQISLDDIEKQNILGNEPIRYAFIDEFGGFGFDFSKPSTSKLFILCATIVKSEDLEELSQKIVGIRNKFFSKSEMKSSNIGSDDRRRTVILADVLQLKFRAVLFIANKEDFYSSALTNYKQTFYKYMHKLLYETLYRVYPKLKIYADQLGDDEFRNGFKKYVENNRPKYNLLNDYDFNFVDSKDSNIVQLSDIIVGSIARHLNEPSAPNFLEILRGKIQHIEYFPNKGTPQNIPTDLVAKFDKKIYSLSYDLATNYIDKNCKSDDNEVRLRVGFLKILLFEVQNGNPFKYVTSNQIINILNEYVDFKVTRDHLYRRIVAPLRDDKVIIASSKQGYKIPVNTDDIYTYLNQTNNIVSPMLQRIEICRDLIKTKTDNQLDVLDHIAYLKYKKYFD